MTVVCRTDANSIVPKSVFKIHPAIGIARLGDHPTQFFVGPEAPFGGAAPQGGKFKDGGKVKRQGARFRIFDYGDVSPTGIPNCEPREINIKDPQVKKIEWTVELANRKASFFQFNGSAGDNSPYAVAPFRPFELRRNAGDTSLEIAPGPRKATAQKGLAPTSPGGQFVDAGAHFTFTNPKVPALITTLGDLFLDLDGNLVVLGGHGKSAANAAVAPLADYANNNHWFDDVSDGPVTAKVTLTSGKVVTCEGAWVICGPPDFAPAVRNVVTLFDLLWDVAVRLLGPLPSDDPRFDRGWKRLADQKTAMAAYKPSWQLDIEPVIQAAMDMSAVYQPAGPGHGLMTSNALFDPSPAGNGLRALVLSSLRPPPGVASAGGPMTMPRLLGDEPYEPSHPRYRATVTPTQYALLQKWAAGNFIDDHGVATVPAMTPENLDQAALENCVGAAMYPGIEASWLIRNPALFKEPFRIKHGATLTVTAKTAAPPGPHTEILTVRPGFFTQQMALPWQADFADCKRETVLALSPPATPPPDLGQEFGWWPGQRPDEVPGGPPWARPTTGLWPADPSQPGFSPNGFQPSHAQMVANVMKFGFVVRSGASFIEDDRNPSVP